MGVVAGAVFGRGGLPMNCIGTGPPSRLVFRLRESVN